MVRVCLTAEWLEHKVTLRRLLETEPCSEMDETFVKRREDRQPPVLDTFYFNELQTVTHPCPGTLNKANNDMKYKSTLSEDFQLPPVRMMEQQEVLAETRSMPYSLLGDFPALMYDEHRQYLPITSQEPLSHDACVDRDSEFHGSWQAQSTMMRGHQGTAAEKHDQQHKKKNDSRRCEETKKYFADAAKRSRQRKRKERVDLIERNLFLEQENEFLATKVNHLKQELGELSPHIHIRKFMDQETERENAYLKQEVKHFRHMATNLKQMFASFKSEVDLSSRFLGFSKERQRLFTEIFEMSALSMKSTTWEMVDLGSLSLPRFPCRIEYREDKSNFLNFRIDLIGLPISHKQTTRLFNYLMNPKEYTRRTGERLSLRYGADEHEYLGYFDETEQLGGEGAPMTIVQYSEERKEEKINTAHRILQTKTLHRFDADSFPELRPCELSAAPQPSSSVDANVFLSTALPSDTEKLIAASRTRDWKQHGGRIVQGNVIREGAHGTTNIATMHKSSSLADLRTHFEYIRSYEEREMTREKYRKICLAQTAKTLKFFLQPSMSKVI